MRSQGIAPLSIRYAPPPLVWRRPGNQGTRPGNTTPVIWRNPVSDSPYPEIIQGAVFRGKLLNLQRRVEIPWTWDGEYYFRDERRKTVALWGAGVLVFIGVSSFVLAVLRGLYKKTVP